MIEPKWSEIRANNGTSSGVRKALSFFFTVAVCIVAGNMLAPWVMGPSAAEAQSAEFGCAGQGPECEPLELFPFWPGEQVRGTVAVVFTEADGFAGFGGTVAARLSDKNGTPLGFGALLPDQNYDLNHMNDSLDAVIAALRADALGALFPASCGSAGDECEVDIRVRKLGNIACDFSIA